MKYSRQMVLSVWGRILLTLLLILVISTLPSLFSYGRPSVKQYYSNSDDPDFIGKKLYKLHFHPENLWRKPFAYFRKIGSDDFFKYKAGKTIRHYLREVPRYFKVSLFFLSVSCVISLLTGLFLSLQNARKRRNPLSYELLSFMAVFPDFILIFLIQFAFFYVNQWAGRMLVRTHTLQSSDRAVLLPLLVMCLCPVLHIVRTLGGRLKEEWRQPYISFSMAKGLSLKQVTWLHLGPAAVKYIKGDLHKIVSLQITNLFICELMFNNKGMTSFLFNNISEYSATVNSVALMLFLYFLVYGISFLFLSLLGFLLRREYL